MSISYGNVKIVNSKRILKKYPPKIPKYLQNTNYSPKPQNPGAINLNIEKINIVKITPTIHSQRCRHHKLLWFDGYKVS